MMKELAKCRDAGSRPGYSDDTRSGMPIEIYIVRGRGDPAPFALTPKPHEPVGITVHGSFSEPQTCRAPSSIEATRMLAEREGILFGPIWSGKGMARLIKLLKQRHFTQGQFSFFCTLEAPRLCLTPEGPWRPERACLGVIDFTLEIIDAGISRKITAL